MREAFGEGFWFQAANQCDVPAADGREHRERGGRVICSVDFRPLVLIEGLDDVMVLGERLAQTVREDDFAIRQMADDFAYAPLSRRGPLIGAFRAERANGGSELARGCGDHLLRIAVSQMRCVGIHGQHLTTRILRAQGASIFAGRSKQKDITQAKALRIIPTHSKTK